VGGEKWPLGENDAPQNSLIDTTTSPKVKTMKEGIGVHSLICSTYIVERHIRTSGWGLGQMTSESIIHMNLHKLNNKLGGA
jgi:hypothetical protein